MRVFIIDDEPLARRRLRRMLADAVDIDIVGESADAKEAISAIARLEPDLIFLDIEMPGATGFDVVSSLPEDEAPVVIFVTAFAEHAVRAFDAEATDYLLKPFDASRLAIALERGRRRMVASKTRTNASAADEAANDPRASDHLSRIPVTTGNRTVFVPLAEVAWIRADRNYAVLHQGPKQHLVRATLTGLEERLDPTEFVRVHRSAIVRIDQVKELRTLPTGTHIAVLEDGTQVGVSQRYWTKITRSF